jgi:molybdate transport system substrate-binding protein
MIESWGMKDAMAGKLVQAPAGRPVASLIAQGEVEIGMQQYSELMNVAGVEILGALPPGAEIISVFTAGVCAASAQPDRALRYVEFLASAEMAQVKQRQGFEAA